MKKVKVKITGTADILCHRFAMEKDDKDGKKDKQYIPEEDAEKSLYKDENGCYIPSSMLEASCREAAKNFKNKKSNYSKVIQSSVFANEDKIYLGKQTYDSIDQRPVVVQRARIVRSRPKFNSGWSLETTFSFDDDRISEKTLKDIFVEAGAIKGIGDHRPKFGRFKLDNFEIVE